MESMALYLDLNTPPQYICSSMRKFHPNEYHVTRTTAESVLIFMFDGVLRFEEDGEETDVYKGEYYIQRGGRAQTGKRASSSPEYFYIHFNGTYKDSSQNVQKNSVLPLRGTFDICKIKPYIEKLMLLGYRASTTEYACVFYEILTALFSAPEFSLAERIRRYIIENADQPLSLNTLSRVFYCSKNKLIDTFRNAYGETPYAYYTEYRLVQARLLVLSTDLPLCRIAEKSGYRDYMMFYKAFVKRFGIAPAVARKARETPVVPAFAPCSPEIRKDKTK